MDAVVESTLSNADELRAQWSRLAAIASDSGENEMVFWFGRDLFCQVILWSLLSGLGDKFSTPMSLVLPCGERPRCLNGDVGEFRAWWQNRQPVADDTRALRKRLGVPTSPMTLVIFKTPGTALPSGCKLQSMLISAVFQTQTVSAQTNADFSGTRKAGESGTRFGPLFQTFTNSRRDLGWGDLGVVEILHQPNWPNPGDRSGLAELDGLFDEPDPT